MPTSNISDSLLDKIREENLNVYRASIQRLREDVGQESQIAQDYRGRLIYELLQNADDAMSTTEWEPAEIAFILNEDALWVANSGRPLDEPDVRGLCGISASSKSQGENGGRRLATRAWDSSLSLRLHTLQRFIPHPYRFVSDQQKRWRQ